MATASASSIRSPRPSSSTRRSSPRSIAASVERGAGAGHHPRHDGGRSVWPARHAEGDARRGGRGSTGSIALYAASIAYASATKATENNNHRGELACPSISTIAPGRCRLAASRLASRPSPAVIAQEYCQGQSAKVALVLHGNLGDKSFFDSAAAGVDKAEAELAVEVKIIEAGYDRSQVAAGAARRRRRAAMTSSSPAPSR